MKRNLTLAPPDRLRRGYAAAFWQVLWLGGIIVLLSPAAGEPFRWAANDAIFYTEQIGMEFVYET